MADSRTVDALLEELDAARDGFHEALGEVDADLVTVPGVVDAWSVRDLVVHVAAWCEHASEMLALLATGREAAWSYSRDDTDAMNEGFHAEGLATSPSGALEREDRSFADFRARVASLDPRVLDRRLGNGDTVEEVIRYDGPEHYAEHTAHLRAWFSGDHEDDDEDGPAEVVGRG